MKSGFSRLAGFAAPHKKKYFASVVCAVIGVACSMVPYFAVSRIIVLLAANNAHTPNKWIYAAWCGVAALGYLGKVLFHSISTTLSHSATFAVLTSVRQQIADKLTRVPMGYILDTPSGKLKNTMVEKVESIEPPLAHVLPEMTSNLLIPLFIVVYLFILDVRMGFISLITLPVGAVCCMMMMKDYETRFNKYISIGKQMNATAVEYINGIEVIKAFGRSAASYQKFADAVTANAIYGLEWMKGIQFYFAMGIGIWPAVLIGVLPAGCIFYMNGTLSVSVFITVIILALGIISPLLAALFFIDDIAKIGTIMNDIGAVLDEKELVRPADKVRFSGMDITLSHVGFAYGEKEVLHDISLAIPKGSVTALVGPSGSGKSTMAKLIASFWDTGHGAITIGGADMKTIPVTQLTDNIAYVAQDNYLFDMSVMENIRMGSPEASDETIIAAAKAAGCHEFIMSLEQGYDTVAGSGGTRLSGGERQRITIARAMLKDAPIVILDEATAYTDPENEAVLQAAIAGLVKGKTLIVIAHRLSTITDADQIVVVSQGKIEAMGTHQALLEGCSLYRHMWQSHMGARDRADTSEEPTEKQNNIKEYKTPGEVAHA